MKKGIVSALAVVMLFAVSTAFAKILEPDGTEVERLAGKTVNATVGAYNEETKTFEVFVYDYDRYDEEDVGKLAAGDTILAGGWLHTVIETEVLDGTTVFRCGDGDEIYFEKSGDGHGDMIARSTWDDRIFMHAVNVLNLPAAEGIVHEDHSDPDLDAGMIVTEGLEAVLKVKAEKEETSIGFDFYATTVTLNENLEIVKIHQDFDVAQ